jgi:O-antigen ligase
LPIIGIPTIENPWTFDVNSNNRNSELGTDRWIAVMGSMVPAGMVLGVVVYEALISLAGLVWLISRLKFPVDRKHIVHNVLFWPVIGWFAVVMLSRVINWGTPFQLAHDLAFIRFPLFAVAMWDVSGRIPVHRYLIGGLLAGIAYALLNLITANLIGHDFIGKPLSRYVSKLNEGARIGGLCAYAAPFLILWGGFVRNLNRRHRIGLLAFGLIAALLVINSQVRTAAMAAVVGSVGGLLALLILRKELKIKSIIALSVLTLLGAWGVYRLQPSMASIYDRVYFWKVSWHLWVQHPLLGVGISSFNEAYRLVAESGIVKDFAAPNGVVYHSVNPRHAHNLVLQLMACNGLLGLGAFGWVFWRMVQTVWKRSAPWHTGLLSWPFVCVMVGLTGWNIYDPFYTSIIFYFLVLAGVPAGVWPRVQPNQL